MRFLGEKLNPTIFSVCLVLLTACNNPMDIEIKGTKESGSANGSGASTVASGQTSVMLSPPSGTTFKDFTVELGSDFLDTNICSGRSIFGRSGIALCNSSFSDLAPSKMHRNVATPQMTLTTESSISIYASGYRDIPDVTKDDEGYHSSSPVVKAVRPTITCGISQATIAGRIADCLVQNPGTATWSGSTQGISGEGTWALVTRTSGAKEVWRDERTGLLWGDSVPSQSWCRASGNAQTSAQDGTGTGICDPADPSGSGAQDATPTSVCSESGSLAPALGSENWSTPVYDDSKGGMGAVATGSSPSVRWRLPTLSDWREAHLNGMRFVLPNMAAMFWVSSVVSSNRDYAWIMDGVNGYDVADFRYNSYSVRCLGR